MYVAAGWRSLIGIVSANNQLSANRRKLMSASNGRNINVALEKLASANNENNGNQWHQ
jgi:hypothetical protein